MAKGGKRSMAENMKNWLLADQTPFGFLMENLPDIVAYLDRRYRYILIYPIGPKPLAISPEIFLGKTPRELGCPPSLASLFTKTFARVFKTGKPAAMEFDYSILDGVHHFRTTVTPTFTDNSRVNAVIMISCELTGEKQTMERFLQKKTGTEESEEKFQEIIRYAPAGIFEVDIHGPKVKHVNDYICRTLGYSRQELQTMNLYELLDEGSKTVLRERIKKLLAGETIDTMVEYKLKAKNGREYYTVVNVVFTYKDGKPQGSIGIAYDITERKQHEKALLESENCLRLALERAGVGVWIVDPKDGWKFTPQINILFGRPAESAFMSEYDFSTPIYPEDLPHLIKAWFDAMENSGNYYQEYRVIWPDGSIHWLSSKGIVLTVAGGLKRFEGITFDITERKQAEEKIHHQNAILEGINRIFREALAWNTEAELSRACLAVAEEVTQSQFGFIAELNSQGEMGEIVIEDLGRDANWPEGKIAHREMLEGLKLGGIYDRILHDGKSFFANDLASHPGCVGLLEGSPPLKSFLGTPLVYNGKTIGMIGLGNRHGGYRAEDLEALETLARTIVQVFMRKRAEQAQLKSQLMLETVIASMTDGLAIIDTEGNYLILNDALARINKFTSKDQYFKNMSEFFGNIEPYTLDGRPVTVEDLPAWKALHGEILSNYELMGKLKDSGETWVVSYSSAPVRDMNGNIIAAVTTARDTTAQKEVAAVLRESEEKLRLALDAAQLGMWDWNLENDELGWSERCRALFGMSPDTVFTYDRFLEAVHPDDRERINYAVLVALSYKQDYDEEMRVIWPDDSLRWVAMKGLAIYDTSDYPVRMAGIVMDITERKRAEEQLLASERELLKVTLNSLGEGVVATDQQERIILMNETAAKLVGLSQAQAIGESFHKVFDIKDGKTGQPYLTINFPESSQLVLVTKDLLEIPIAVNSSPIRADERIIGTVLVFQDVSIKQKTEQELLRAEKLKSLGILAGGIAHDFNNILAAILCNIQLATLKLKKNEDIHPYLSNTIETTRKASDLTKQLLTFSQGGAPVKKDASLNELIKDTSEFVLRGTKTKAEFAIPDDLWAASIDIGQISQVVNNLVINAQQAMPQGGIIRIYAQNVVMEANSHFKPGKYIKITIQDQGIGIPPANLPKIFDPFFTTKKDGNGLGLATSYSIIAKHNGYIEVESREGAGTSFFIYLPALEVAVLQTKSPEEMDVSGDGLKILIMDDELKILNAVGEMLKYYGYRVALSTDGVEAIALYKQAKSCAEPFDVVIMDLTVPGGMGGQEAIAHLRNFDPQVKVIISSGYADDPIMADYTRYGFMGVVTKPYKIDELNEVILKVVNPAQLPLKLVY
jgi:PAS domain S-box-containing protein